MDKNLQRLRDQLSAGSVAVITMELQEGVVGSGALMGPLVDAVANVGLRAAAGRLCQSARVMGIPVVHCVAENRPDGRGAASNCAVFAMNNRLRRDTGSTPIDIGSPGAELIPEVGPAPEDIVVSRIHGLTPFTQTSLDQILRNLGVDTVVITGVSLNIGVLGTVISAVDLGYRVIVVRDGTCGVPQEYADAIMEHTMPLLATIANVDDVITMWSQSTEP